MAELQFAHPSFIHLLWLIALLAIFLGRRLWQQKNQLQRFIAPHLQPLLVSRSSFSGKMWGRVLVIAVLLCGMIALMRPQTPGAEQNMNAGRTSADLMIVLDLSKSMLAEDAAPNRLQRAKSEIKEMVTQLSGHRVGLVGFAGRASVLCPLTTDYGFFDLALRNAHPTSISKGGTRIGDAMRMAIQAFGPGQSSRIVLLVTDGEDHDSYPKEQAQKAKDQGIRIVTIGFGSEDGSQITLTDEKTGAKSILKDRDGKVVLSRLDGEMLREIALLTEGAYVPAGTAALDLESIVGKHIQPIVNTSAPQSTKVIPHEHYPAFILLAMLLLLLAVWIERRPRQVQA